MTVQTEVPAILEGPTYRVRVTLFRLRGRSGPTSCPRRSAWSWPITIDTIGPSHSGVPARARTASAPGPAHRTDRDHSDMGIEVLLQHPAAPRAWRPGAGRTAASTVFTERGWWSVSKLAAEYGRRRPASSSSWSVHRGGGSYPRARVPACRSAEARRAPPTRPRSSPWPTPSNPGRPRAPPRHPRRPTSPPTARRSPAARSPPRRRDGQLPVRRRGRCTSRRPVPVLTTGHRLWRGRPAIDRPR